MQLYKIPRDPTIARRWLDACGYEGIPVTAATMTFKVCREHFTSNDFDGTTTLRVDAVPSLFTTHSRSLMGKQDPNGSSSSSINSTPAAKRFRSDMASIRAKQTAPMTNPMNNKRNSIPYRTPNNNPSYQRAQLGSNHHQLYQNNNDQQLQILSPSPQHESFDENSKLINPDVKQTNDIELTMNCLEEPLTDAQLNHRSVKVICSFVRKIEILDRSS